MPQIYFEYSSNIVEENFKETINEIHKILVEKLPTKLENCKTRIIKYDDYIVGDGNINNGFIHLIINILPGRDRELIDSIANDILNYLKKNFAESLKKLNLQISIAIENITETYYKFAE